MTCPMCAKEAVALFRPFCSKRCADLDLGRWLTGAYSIESAEPDDPDGEEDRLSPGFLPGADPS